MLTYETWTAAYLARNNNFVRGKCQTAVKEMCAAFPELRPARGFVTCYWGEDQHWWCVTPNGDIVDPTATQFGGTVMYEELDMSNPRHRDRVPIGKCAYCGALTFARSYSQDFCEVSHATAFADALNQELR